MERNVYLACSRRSNSGGVTRKEGAKDSPIPTPIIHSPFFALFVSLPHYPNAWNRLMFIHFFPHFFPHTLTHLSLCLFLHTKALFPSGGEGHDEDDDFYTPCCSWMLGTPPKALQWNALRTDKLQLGTVISNYFLLNISLQSQQGRS